MLLQFIRYFYFLIIVFVLTNSAFAQTVTVVSPNGGEKFISNESKEIVWKSSDVQNVKIEYSADNGATWNIISSSFPAFLGSYVWTLPVVSSGQVIIKIADARNSLVLDMSDYTFEIEKAPFLDQGLRFDNTNMNDLSGSLILTAPNPTSNGSIVLEAGTSTNIEWTSSGITNINIEYSINGGVNWHTIVTNISASSGYYQWSIPGNIQPTTQAVIRITEVGGGASIQNEKYIFMKSPQTFGGLKIAKVLSGSTVEILPFGDSITHGRFGDGDDNYAGDNAGYEFVLWDSLRQNNYDFDFIGNKYSGYNYFPDYQNAGFPGYLTSDALSILTTGHVADNFDNKDDTFAPGPYLDYFPSDVVLIHIGTNDFFSGITPSQAADNVTEMLDNIHDADPTTWIVLAKILRSIPEEPDMATFNGLIEDSAQARISDGYNILIVDMYNLLQAAEYNDGAIHPNAAGYAEMAQVWYNALKLILPAGTASAPVFSPPSVDVSANVGMPFNYQAAASGIGTPEYSLSGTFPSGMNANSIDKYTGKIAWTPSSIGSQDYTVTVQATNSSGSDNQILNIHVYEASNKPTDLVLHLKFNNAQGTGHFKDNIDTNNANIEGTLIMADGRIEKAASFGGSFSSNKTYILQNENIDFVSPGSTEFTVEAWIKPGSTLDTQIVAGQYSASGESHWWLGLTAGKPTFQYHKANDDVDLYSDATASSSVSTTEWTHIVGVKDNNLKIYVNGVLTTGDAVTGGVKALRPIDIGNYQNTKFYDGLIDDIAIYNSALGTSTIQDHYKNGIYSVQTNVTAFLQGPYNGTNMNTDLIDDLASFPDNQPYSVSPWNYPGLESNSTPPSTVVDWVLLELRTGTLSSTIVSKRAAFVLSNGSIVGLSGSGAVNLYGVLPGKYYITVKHRNHLAVMTKDPVLLKSSTAESFSFNNQAQVHGTNPMADLGGGNYGMYSGDANASGTITYNGADHTEIANDRGAIYIRIGSGSVNATVSGYYLEDVNLTGIVTYNGADGSSNFNDRGKIYDTIGAGSVNATVSTQVP